MTFEVVAACIHVVDNMDINTHALYMKRETQSLGFQKKINPVLSNGLSAVAQGPFKAGVLMWFL